MAIPSRARLKGGTLFSGIGAPEAAAPQIDWRWCAEIDPFACAVLAARFPGSRNLGDVTKIEPKAIEPVDLVVFGSPCQSFSVAGLRQGMDDPRGNLALLALELIGRIGPQLARPRWIVFENVPGLLSSRGGRDFGAILGALAKCGYGFAYRILDAQFFGVPQRRRRLFVVGCLGDWRAAAAVLFERDSLRRDPPPRPKAGQGIAPILEARAAAGGAGSGTDFLAGSGLAVPLLEVGTRNSRSADEACCGLGIGEPGEPMYALQRGKQHGIAYGGNRQSGPLEVATAVRAHGGVGHMDFESETFIVSAIRTAQTGANGCGIAGNVAHTLDGAQGQAIAFESRYARNGRGAPSAVVPPLKAQSGQTGKGDAAPLVVAEPLSVNGYGYTHEGKVFRLRNCVGMPPRRLTPRECERLQGLPDGWTAITYRGKSAADGPRYRAIGNSMAVPVMRWILTRVETAPASR